MFSINPNSGEPIYRHLTEQVKRMVAAVGNHCEGLHRSAFGELTLADGPAPGQWRFVTDAERQAIIAIQPYPTQAPQPLVLNPQAWITQTRDIKETGWQVSILAPRTLVDRSVQTVMAIGAGTLLVLMLLAGLVMQRRRHYIDRIDFEARGRQELEKRYQDLKTDAI